MNLSRSFQFFIALCIAFQDLCFCSSDLMTFKKIESARVDFFTQKSANEVMRTKLIKKAMVGAAVVGSGVVIYNWLTTPPLTVPVPCAAIKEDSTCSQAFKEFLVLYNDTSTKVGLIHQSLRDSGVLIDSQGNAFFEWIKSWKPLFLSALMSGIISASLSPFFKYFKAFDEAVDRTVAKLFYENRLSWYLAHRVHLPLILTDLESVSLRVDQGEQIMPELQTSWAIFVGQIESILGFMEYRKKSLGSYVRERAHEISRKITETIDSAADQLERKSLEAHKAYKQLIVSMRAQLDIELRAFADIELIDLD